MSAAWPPDPARPPAEVLPPEAELFAPFSGPVILHDGNAVVPHPLGGHALVPFGEGIHLAWCDFRGAAVLCVFGGHYAHPGFASICSRQGIRELIADLQSIDRQLDGAR